MPKLSGLFFILSLFVFSFLFLLPRVTSVRANPMDVFYNNSIQRLNQDKKDSYNKAASENSPQLFDQPVKERDFALTTYSITNAIGCTDMEFCSQNQTALGNVALAIDSVIAHPPASGIYYVYDLLNHSGILASPAYAQGIGFAGLSPLLPLWKITRNISYAAIIIIMVAIGFMVIFRTKIDPKTVISVQAALPKIIFSLFLITLSYPIAGFMVDLMYLVMSIVISILAGGFTNSGKTAADFQSYYLTSGWIDLLHTVFWGGFKTVDDFFLKNMTGLFSTMSLTGIVVGLITQQWITGVIGGAAISLLLILILFLGLLFTFIRILLLLLNSYIQLLIAIVLGPIQLLFEAIPGRSAFSEWILNIIANLVVFPTTVAILMFAEYLAQMGTGTDELFSPPLIGVPSKGTFTAFLGLGVLFLAPTLIASVKKQFHPKPALPLTAGTAFAPLTGAAQTSMGAASQFYYLQQMPILNRFLGGGQAQHKPSA